MTIIFEMALSAALAGIDDRYVVRCVLVFGGGAKMDWKTSPQSDTVRH